jgi:L-threonate 2-dehydrogenase
VKAKPRVGIIGIGIMGSAYAEHLLANGFELTGYDIDSEALARFETAGGKPAVSSAGVAANSEIVLTALPSDESLETAFFGERGLLSGARDGLVVLEMGTFSLDVKEKARARLGEHGIVLLDCPVSGTGSQALRKDLAVYASGNSDAFDACRIVLEALSRKVWYVGEFGMGSKLKYIANLLVTIHNLSTAEALIMGQKAGIDGELLYDVIADSAGTSRMFEVRGPLMLKGEYDDPTMKIDVYQKDIEIIADFARSVASPTPLFSTSAEYYVAALAEGRAKQDTAAVATVLARMAGIPVADPKH